MIGRYTKIIATLVVLVAACTAKPPQKLHYEVVPLPGPPISRDNVLSTACDVAESLQEALKKQKNPTPEVIGNANMLRVLVCYRPGTTG